VALVERQDPVDIESFSGRDDRCVDDPDVVLLEFAVRDHPARRFVFVVFEDESMTPPDASGKAVRGRHLDAAGMPIDNEFVVSSSLEGDQSDPACAAYDQSVFAVWLDAQPEGSSCARASCP
jgi:hypothetical protein